MAIVLLELFKTTCQSLNIKLRERLSVVQNEAVYGAFCGCAAGAEGLELVFELASGSSR